MNIGKLVTQKDRIEQRIERRRREQAADQKRLLEIERQIHRRQMSNVATIADAIREALATSGKSANEIAKIINIPQPTISRFLRGHEMGIQRASKIAAYLGLELKKKNKGRTKSRSP